MKSTAAVCILAALCTCQTVSGRSVDVNVQPELNVTIQDLNKLVLEIHDVKDYFFIDAYLDLHQRLFNPLNQTFNRLNFLQTQIQTLTREGKGVENCTNVLKENGDAYKAQYINATAGCAKDVKLVLSQIDDCFGELYAVGENLLQELVKTNCEESTDVELCKSTAVTKAIDFEASYLSVRKEANYKRIHAISALKLCLKNPVTILKRQVQELETSTANCLRDL
ncbi:hypothetical protein KM043_018618 [Ampulex compressa]|nr:hypothetical protein KM043_018618 [Ampulex compressa]